MREPRARSGCARVCGGVIDGIDQCVFPCECRRLKEWKAFYDNIDYFVSAGAPFFVGIVQKVGWYSCFTPLPTRTRNLLLLNLADPHLVASTERFLSQGHPVSREGVGHRLTGMLERHACLAWASCYQAMTRRVCLSLLGNGHHTIYTGIGFLYVLSNLVHVDNLDYNIDLIGEQRVGSPALLMGAVVDFIEEV